jgi:hypothetical protein
MLILSLLLSLGSSKEAVICETIAIPTLTAPIARFRSAVVCYPNENGNVYPLHLLAHGDFGGGGDLFSYQGLQKQIAGYGFVVVAWASCSADVFCDNGEGSFLEAIKTIQFFEAEQNRKLTPIDFDSAYSASGHSTGARVVLMLAAIIDTPAYLSGTKYAANLTDEVRASLSKIRAVVADHPDPMSDDTQYPDLSHFNITKTPVMIITGTNDRIEPLLSGWDNFKLLQTPNKVFMNIANATHLQPIEAHKEGPYLSFFSQYFALANITAAGMIYGDGPGSLLARSHEHFTAQPGERNTGDGKVGFVACGAGHPAVPASSASYCTAPG